MKWVVIDASVVVRAICEEQPVINKKFLKLLKKAKNEEIYLFSPPIFWTECANALRFATKNEQLSKKALQKIFNLPIRLTQPTNKSVIRALNISYQLGDTVYDSWYHVTALWLGATFITADKKYYNKAKNIGSIECWG